MVLENDSNKRNKRNKRTEGKMIEKQGKDLWKTTVESDFKYVDIMIISIMETVHHLVKNGETFWVRSKNKPGYKVLGVYN
jgi:hypothetical protein